MITFVIYSSGVFLFFLFFGGDCVAYNDLVTDVASFTTQASAASSDLAGVVAGADVLATQFDSLKSTVDSLSIALNELTGGQYTVLKDTAAARPVTPSTGQLFFASDTRALSLYGGSWGVVSPTGIVSPFAGASAPEGWLLCDGSAVSQITYAALYAVVGANAFGTDGGGNFSLPNLKGRTVIGVGVGTEITGVRGTLQGVKEVLLTAAETAVRNHTHTMKNHTHSGSTGGQSNDHSHNIGLTQDSVVPRGTSTAFDRVRFAGSVGTSGVTADHNHGFTTGIPSDNTTDGTTEIAGAAHTNIQPSLPLNYIIKV